MAVEVTVIAVITETAASDFCAYMYAYMRAGRRDCSKFVSLLSQMSWTALFSTLLRMPSVLRFLKNFNNRYFFPPLRRYRLNFFFIFGVVLACILVGFRVWSLSSSSSLVFFFL
jgi:hypothetical protein